MTRSLKNQPGDYVAVPVPGQPDAVGRVTEATSVRVVVKVGATTRTFDHPLPRLRWARQRGRSVLVPA